MNNAFWWWLGRHKKAKDGRPVGGPNKKRGDGLTFDNGGRRQFQCRGGFQGHTCLYDRWSCVLLNIMFVVGRQAVSGSNCINKQSISKQSKHMQRGQSSHAAPGAIFGRAFGQTLIGTTFPHRNSVSLKSDIASKQCPCTPLDTETCSSKSETFITQEEDVVARKVCGNVSARPGFTKKTGP